MDTDVTTLVDEAARFLVTFLPYLAPVGEAAAKEMGTRAVGGAAGLAKALWVRIRGGLSEPERIERAAVLAPAAGGDPAVEQELRCQLAQALTDDPTLVKALREALGHPDPQPSESKIGVQYNAPVTGGVSFGIGQQVNLTPQQVNLTP